jgi:hypothetical protein
MSHILGHWENEGQASVGADTLKRKFCAISLSNGTENVLLLGVNNFGYHGPKKAQIGFHLNVIASEVPDQYYGIAFDIVDWDDHVDAEAYFKTMMNDESDEKKLEDFSEAEFQAFNTLPDNTEKLDQAVLGRLNRTGNEAQRQERIQNFLQTRNEKLFQVKQVIQQTLRYKKTNSFMLLRGKSEAKIAEMLLELPVSLA